MHAELVSIDTDTDPLTGLFYQPQAGIGVAALLMHGNCHNFYSGPCRFLPSYLLERGIACLAFNRRGHGMVVSLSGREVGGGSFQLAREGIADNRYASDWLSARGYARPIVIGHSNGGMLAAQHCADDYGDPRALVLMSAHCGGTANVPLMSEAGLFAGDRLAELTERAESLVQAGRGRELMLMPGWWWVISAESFLDRVHDTPDTVANAQRIRIPSLYLRGDQEPRESYPAEAFAAGSPGSCDVRILPECDHFYTGHEAAVGTLVADWAAAHT